MQFVDADEGAPRITGLSHAVEDDQCVLRWIWPAAVDAVYISALPLGGRDGGDEDAGRLKLYTKSEYKANNGFACRLNPARPYRFTVYAFVEGKEGAFLIRQSDGDNRTELSAGKAKIFYSITEKGGLFRKHKQALIEVDTETALNQDVLCYVKKQGGYPANREDGILYPFVTPFSPGRNVLPPIEIGKSEYVRLFLTDGRTHGQLYELIAR
ncbi:beta-mannanase [Paenibacillus sp. J5C_2022]|uniref:beta-mannanase n=1 Tax=Paenibacillus sp. J5C2022 TaxID=2977129 RepID=UPI0021D35ADF|nr:beta-mannanase [Paenibacillus sp. J5C2022]MCU6710015.1 beta-mannanase [Paenibacillus sp. J5C2022]